MHTCVSVERSSHLKVVTEPRIKFCSVGDPHINVLRQKGNDA